MFHPWRQKKDCGIRESPSGNLLAVPNLDRGFVARNGERGEDGAGWRMEGQHQGE